MKDNCKTWIYCRTAQASELSLAAQQYELTAYAERHGFTVTNVIAECGSGNTLNREGIHKIRYAVKQGEIDAILVRDVSRIGRDVLKVASFLRWLKQHNVRLLCMDFGDDVVPPFLQQCVDIVQLYDNISVAKR